MLDSCMNGKEEGREGMKNKDKLSQRVDKYMGKIENIDKLIEAQKENAKVIARKERVKLNHLKKKKMLLMRKRNYFVKKLWGVETDLIPNKGWRDL